MKETIYTIPINEAYDKKCGCPVCRLEDDLERTSIEYIMGAAMMEPDVRTETNKYGFCPRHYSQMYGVQKRLSLALILESHLKELQSMCFHVNFDKLGKKELEAITERLALTTDNCFVCNQLETRLDKYYRNIVYLWQTDETFRKKTREQEYFCLNHLAKLLEYGRIGLDKKRAPQFFADHLQTSQAKIDTLAGEVSTFCKSFDHRFSNMPLGQAKHAVEHSIAYLNGCKNEMAEE